MNFRPQYFLTFPEFSTNFNEFWFGLNQSVSSFYLSFDNDTAESDLISRLEFIGW